MKIKKKNLISENLASYRKILRKMVILRRERELTGHENSQ